MGIVLSGIIYRNSLRATRATRGCCARIQFCAACCDNGQRVGPRTASHTPPSIDQHGLGVVVRTMAPAPDPLEFPLASSTFVYPSSPSVSSSPGSDGSGSLSRRHSWKREREEVGMSRPLVDPSGGLGPSMGAASAPVPAGPDQFIRYHESSPRGDLGAAGSGSNSRSGQAAQAPSRGRMRAPAEVRLEVQREVQKAKRASEAQDTSDAEPDAEDTADPTVLLTPRRVNDDGRFAVQPYPFAGTGDGAGPRGSTMRRRRNMTVQGHESVLQGTASALRRISTRVAHRVANVGGAEEPARRVRMLSAEDVDGASDDEGADKRRPSFDEKGGEVLGMRPPSLVEEAGRSGELGPSVGVGALEGRTLGVFHAHSRLRKFLRRVLLHPWVWRVVLRVSFWMTNDTHGSITEPVILGLIVFNAVVLTIQSASPLNTPRPSNGYFNTWEDSALFVLFIAFTWVDQATSDDRRPTETYVSRTAASKCSRASLSPASSLTRPSRCRTYGKPGQLLCRQPTTPSRRATARQSHGSSTHFAPTWPEQPPYTAPHDRRPARRGWVRSRTCRFRLQKAPRATSRPTSAGGRPLCRAANRRTGGRPSCPRRRSKRPWRSRRNSPRRNGRISGILGSAFAALDRW